MPQPALEPIDAFQALHRQLSRAMLACTDPISSETMRLADAVILDAITALNQADFHARTAEFQELSVSVKDQMKKLTELKERIDRLVGDIALTTRLCGAIDSAVAVAAKAFPV